MPRQDKNDRYVLQRNSKIYVEGSMNTDLPITISLIRYVPYDLAQWRTVHREHRVVINGAKNK
jgi:hypothetical protein